MNGFSRLQVKGYRRLRAIDIELRPLNVLIGANGIGKSSVLEVLDLLASSAEGKLESSISSSGGLSSLLTANGQTDRIDLVLEMPVENLQPIWYRLALAPRGPGYVIPFEQLTQQQRPDRVQPFKFIDAAGPRVHYRRLGDTKFLEPTWDYKWTETALSQVPKMYQRPESFRKLLGSSTEIYHTLDIGQRAPVRLPQSLQPAETPAANGEHLLSCLHSMREVNRDRFEAIEDALKSAFPTFERIDLPAAAAGSLTLRWNDRNLTEPLYPHQLSEGTLRFLWLVTLLQSPGLPKVTLIDEPEVSLHPEMLQLLAELMREASDRSQLIIATHSDRLLRFLDPGEVIVFDMDDDGVARVRRADSIDLEAWINDYTLDELWRLGRLGGRA